MNETTDTPASIPASKFAIGQIRPLYERKVFDFDGESMGVVNEEGAVGSGLSTVVLHFHLRD